MGLLQPSNRFDRESNRSLHIDPSLLNGKMNDRSDCFSWTGVGFGIASLVMFGLAQHEGKKAKQLAQAHPLTSVAAAADLARFLPVLIAVRGRANSDEPVTSRISPVKAVLIEETEELSALKQNDKGAWTPEFKIVRHNRSTQKWFISDNGRARLGVEEAFDASMLENALTSQKQFREGQTSAYHRLISRLSGYQPLGVWETERVLPVGTAVTVVGELAKSSDGRDDMVVRKPCGPLAGRPFYITRKSFEELQESLRRNTGTCKWLGIGFGAISVILLGFQFWKRVRSALRYHRIRKQLAEEEKRRRVERATNTSPDRRLQEEDEERGKCIVCWDRPVDAVFIPCGHLCACLRCCLELNRCPICRKSCTVHKIYLA